MDDLRTVLHHYLQDARDALLWKLDGLDERALRLPRTPTGTNLLGLVKHAAGVEIGYFGECFGRDFPGLDALDAYNQKLVKKIAVRGITVKGLAGSTAYLYVDGLEVGKGADFPKARVELEAQSKAGPITRKTVRVQKGSRLHDLSGEIEAYRDLVVVDEDEIQRARSKSVIGAQPADGRAAVAEGPHHHRRAVADPRVIPDAPGDGRVRIHRLLGLGLRRVEHHLGRQRHAGFGGKLLVGHLLGVRERSRRSEQADGGDRNAARAQARARSPRNPGLHRAGSYPRAGRPGAGSPPPYGLIRNRFVAGDASAASWLSALTRNV